MVGGEGGSSCDRSESGSCGGRWKWWWELWWRLVEVVAGVVVEVVIGGEGGS